jgi:heme/copper-type cytochrome/quinol oxidase subunit 4
VFSGTLASVALLLRKAWAAPVFVLSLIGIVVQMGHALFMTRALEDRGAGIVVMSLVVTAVGSLLVWYSASAKRKGWLG